MSADVQMEDVPRAANATQSDDEDCIAVSHRRSAVHRPREQAEDSTCNRSRPQYQQFCTVLLFAHE